MRGWRRRRPWESGTGDSPSGRGSSAQPVSWGTSTTRNRLMQAWGGVFNHIPVMKKKERERERERVTNFNARFWRIPAKSLCSYISLYHTCITRYQNSKVMKIIRDCYIGKFKVSIMKMPVNHFWSSLIHRIGTEIHVYWKCSKFQYCYCL